MIIHKIFGGPGVGKTYRLQEIVGMEVQMGTPLKRIAYLSFTRSAREVIIDRLNASEDDVQWFRTIHGACTRIMGFAGAIVTWHDYRKFSDRTGMKITPEELDDYEDQVHSFNPVLRAMNLACNQERSINDVIRSMPPHPSLTQQRAEYFLAEWTKFKRTEYKFDYLDMLTLYDGKPLDIDVGILDEAQDLTPLQWRIVRQLFAKAQRFYMAGDDDQSIYPFIGASEYGFLDHPCDEEEILPVSYRVPKAIGRAAEKIIRKVKHRREKHIRWRDVPGDVTRMSLDAMTIPWKSWIPKYQSIMVLARHRKNARQFSDDLRTIGVPHSLNGESMHAWREAKFLQTYIALKQGEKVLPTAARSLLNELKLDGKRFNGVSRRDRVSRAQVPEINFDDAWVTVLSCGDKGKRKRYEALSRLIRQEGSQVLATEPVVMVGTQHASKGKEAELIIIVPDCTPIVQQHLQDATEYRLAYVTMTRAKQQAVVLMPQTELYVPHYFGG